MQHYEIEIKDNSVLMKPTGIFDIEKKEIFEGDLVEAYAYWGGNPKNKPKKYRVKGLWVIKWSEKKGLFYFSDTNTKHWNKAIYSQVHGDWYRIPPQFHSRTSCEKFQFKIVGNVFENSSKLIDENWHKTGKEMGGKPIYERDILTWNDYVLVDVYLVRVQYVNSIKNIEIWGYEIFRKDNATRIASSHCAGHNRHIAQYQAEDHLKRLSKEPINKSEHVLFSDLETQAEQSQVLKLPHNFYTDVTHISDEDEEEDDAFNIFTPDGRLKE